MSWSYGASNLSSSPDTQLQDFEKEFPVSEHLNATLPGHFALQAAFAAKHLAVVELAGPCPDAWAQEQEDCTPLVSLHWKFILSIVLHVFKHDVLASSQFLGMTMEGNVGLVMSPPNEELLGVLKDEDGKN